MRFRAWLPGLLYLAACSSTPSDASKITLRNTQWDRVNVQVVITRSGTCTDRGAGDVSSQDFLMHKDETKTFVALNGTSVCWRHDRFPNKPTPGEWSGWTHAIPFPGENTTTDL
jgi:hypothetical protein